jgi:DNA modification methylase
MTNRAKYLTINEKLPHLIEDETILNINTNNVTYLTHGFHKYPAKFIPQIPRWAIEKYLGRSKRQLILDPFCGSGTTLVEGAVAGHHVIGVDIDPLSVLIAKVKTTRVNELLLSKISQWVVEQTNNTNSGTFKPACETLEHWFTKENIKKLSKLRTVIDNIPLQFGESTEVFDIRDLLIIAFSSIIRRVSNADNESQKTYVSHTNIKTPEEPIELFLKQLYLFEQRISQFTRLVSTQIKSKIFRSNILSDLSQLVEEQTIDLGITSPPYIKAIDYIYNQMAELFWIGDLFGLETQCLQNNKKKEYIGSKNFHKKDFEEFLPSNHKTDVTELDEKIDQVYSRDTKNGLKHSFITYKYFADMNSHFSQISGVIKRNGHYIMVVGNSKVSNIFFDTAHYLTELAKRHGFQLVNKWGYKIKNRYMRFDRKGRGGIINLDWVLDFIKN